MRNDIIHNIIHDAGSIDNLISIKQDWETENEYRDRIYTTANDLFMQSVTELGLNTLDDEDNALYDDIREETILDIMFMLMYGDFPPMGFSY